MRLIFYILLFLMVGLVFAQDEEGIETELTCEICHAGGDWTSDIGQNFDHIMTGYELKGTHADIDCGRCHTGSTPAEKHNFGQVSSDCVSCHDDIHNDQWGQDCERCHSLDSWSLSTQQQNHDLTNFPLRGPHRSLSCESCHLSNPGSGVSLPLNCNGCHSAQYNTSENPSHQILNLGNDCESCHTPQSNRWDSSIFNHNDTGYYLLGMHNTASCASCHTQSADNTPSECVSCHMTDFEATTEPAHLIEGFPLDCQSCHDSFTWNSSFLHEQTGFLLEGAHETTLCSDCHDQQNFDDTPETCNGCHQSDWEATVTPPHQDAEFDETCDDCHSVNAWTPTTWNHDADTEYPLIGSHIGPSCEACHTMAPYSEQPSECVDCHQVNYEETTGPNHIALGIPTTCEVCHSTIDWENEGLNHELTQFPLEGAHANLLCETCHVDGYDLPITCEGCHLPDYTSTTNGPSPDHTQYGFSQDCLVCHGQVSWKPSSFDHDPNVTGYEIQGAHLNLLPENCFACHETEQWTGLSADCFACHQSNFDNTSNPDHDENGYPQNICETCHSQNAWEPSIFAHEATSITCETCHMVQYTGTTDPPHAELSFPTDCSTCHQADQWSPSSFVHDVETTGFLTDGAHLDMNCSSCHETWSPPTEIRTCASSSCHQDNYAVSTNPPHETMSFSQNCEDCHSTSTWAPSQFQHGEQNTSYPLEGAHTIVACQSCHSPWQIIAQPRTCADGSCHLSDYNSVTDPNHAGASFPLECETCHTTTAWEPSTFDHDGQYFPIYSGQHREEWNDCSQCHVDGTDYGIFTCFGGGCHSVPEMNNEHCEGTNCESCNGITYPSTGVTPEDCLTCHPTGDENDCEGDILNFIKMPTRSQPTEKKPIETH